MTRKTKPKGHYVCDGLECNAIAVYLPVSWHEVGGKRFGMDVRARHYCPECQDTERARRVR